MVANLHRKFELAERDDETIRGIRRQIITRAVDPPAGAAFWMFLLGALQAGPSWSDGTYIFLNASSTSQRTSSSMVVNFLSECYRRMEREGAEPVVGCIA